LAILFYELITKQIYVHISMWAIVKFGKFKISGKPLVFTIHNYLIDLQIVTMPYLIDS